MSILTFAVADRFVVRIIKSYTTNPSRQWSNTYELAANDAGTITDLDTALTNLVAFEKNMHNTFTHFVRGTISTWEADSVPYNPDVFLVSDLFGNGLRDTSGELEPITTCLNIVRQPTSGRQGHLFYRGVLAQADTEAPAGITVLTNPAIIQALLDDSVDAAGIADMFGTTTGVLKLAMINKTGTEGRILTSFAVGGVSQLPVDHAWFNRT